MKMTNETIKKLTLKEMNDLGCFNIGICFYRGEGCLKSRVKGFKTTLKSEDEMHYEKDDFKFTFEFIKMSDGTFAFRVFNNVKDEYENFVQPIWGMRFIR